MSSIDYCVTLSIPSLTLYRPAEASERPDDIIASLESPRQRRAAHLQGQEDPHHTYGDQRKHEYSSS